MAVELETERLILRQWRDSDRDAYFAVNSDPDVRRFYPSIQTREQTDTSLDNIRSHIEEHGWGLWAIEVKESGELAGLTGLWPMPDGFPSGTEIGWRLAKFHWGKGYAPEAARAALEYAFGPLALPEVVSMTTVANEPSRRVMAKIGMTRDPADDFVNPTYAQGSPLAPHVLYRITAAQYFLMTGSAPRS